MSSTGLPVTNEEATYRHGRAAQAEPTPEGENGVPFPEPRVFFERMTMSADDGMGRSVLRLFVWRGFAPDYSDGLAFAVAENIEQAQDLVVKSLGYDPSDWGTVTEHELSSPVGCGVRGGG